jgi:hypothetical protein
MHKQLQPKMHAQFRDKVTDPSVTPPGARANTYLSVKLDTISDSLDGTIISPNHIYNEWLRQARVSFNLAYGLTAVNAIIALFGVLLTFSGNVSASAATATGGLSSGAVSACWLKLCKDSNKRLEETAKFLEDEKEESLVN